MPADVVVVILGLHGRVDCCQSYVVAWEKISGQITSSGVLFTSSSYSKHYTVSGLMPAFSSPHLCSSGTAEFALLGQVKSVSEDKGTADVLRQISDATTADSLVVVSGDTVTDIGLQVS